LCWVSRRISLKAQTDADTPALSAFLTTPNHHLHTHTQRLSRHRSSPTPSHSTKSPFAPTTHTMADHEQPYDPYIPSGGAQSQNGNMRTAALQAVRYLARMQKSAECVCDKRSVEKQPKCSGCGRRARVEDSKTRRQHYGEDRALCTSSGHSPHLV
jgi:hypothetical protein